MIHYELHKNLKIDPTSKMVYAQTRIRPEELDA